MANRTPVPPPTERDTQRLGRKVEKLPSGCWKWLGGHYEKGYALFTINGRNYRAHRVAYVWRYGEPNADLHHTCENRWCVNPEHLTPAAAGQPRHRNAIPGLCARGHEFTPENTYVNPRGERQCRKCLRAATDRYLDRNREEINRKRRERRVRVVHGPRECGARDCVRVFTPERSSRLFCSSACYQRERLRRIGEGSGG